MNLAISVCLTETTEVEKEWDTKWAWVSSAALFKTVPIGLYVRQMGWINILSLHRFSGVTSGNTQYQVTLSGLVECSNHKRFHFFCDSHFLQQ
jgi:hypothetical protein